MVLRFFRQRDDVTTEYSKEWLASVGSFRQVVFDTIESVIIVAALQAAWDKTGHVAFLALWLLTFVTLLAYIQRIFEYVTNAINDRFSLIGNRKVFSYIAGTGSLVFSGLSVHLLSGITSTFITANFMQ